MELPLEKLKKWMGVTDQQFDVLRVIMNLESKQEPPTVKNIVVGYECYNRKRIQKSNLYSTLKILETQNFIAHKISGVYSINYVGLQERFGEVKRTREKEKEELEELYIRTKDNIRRKLVDQRDTFVRYYENKELLAIMSRALSTATAYYSTDRFPNVALPRSLTLEEGKPRYVDLLHDRGVLKKDLELYYLSDLNIVRYYTDMCRFYKNSEFVFNECMGMINKLDNIIENCSNVHVAVSDCIFVVDVHLPENEEPMEYISHMHDLQSRTMGGVYTKSYEAANYIKQYFLKKFDASLKLNNKNKRKVLGGVRSGLKEAHKSQLGTNTKKSIRANTEKTG